MNFGKEVESGDVRIRICRGRYRGKTIEMASILKVGFIVGIGKVIIKETLSGSWY